MSEFAPLTKIVLGSVVVGGLVYLAKIVSEPVTQDPLEFLDIVPQGINTGWLIPRNDKENKLFSEQTSPPPDLTWNETVDLLLADIKDEYTTGLPWYMSKSEDDSVFTNNRQYDPMNADI
jgi:hypothetical protein